MHSLWRALGGFAIVGPVACVLILAISAERVGGYHRDLIVTFGPLIGGAFNGSAGGLRRPVVCGSVGLEARRRSLLWPERGAPAAGEFGAERDRVEQLTRG